MSKDLNDYQITKNLIIFFLVVAIVTVGLAYLGIYIQDSDYRKNIETNINHNKRKEFFDSILMNKMKLLENMLLNDNYFKDLNSLSIAEIAIWRIFGWFSSGLIEGFPTNFVKQLKTIQMICLKVEKFDFVKEWISKTYHLDYVRGNYI